MKIKEGDIVAVKKGMGSACDGMTGKVVYVMIDTATIEFEGDGVVDLPLSYLVKIS